MTFTNAARTLSKQDYFTRAELEAIKADLPNDRFGLFFRLLLTSGARCNEALSLTKASFNRDNSTVYIKANKNSKDRELQIDHSLVDSILAIPGDKPFDFNDSWARQKWYKIRPRQIKKHIHCFRHTFGVELYKATKDIMFVKEAMGHKALTSTLCYVQCVDFESKMNEAHKTLANLI